MQILSISSACTKKKQAYFGARFKVTTDAIKLIKQHNQYIGDMEKNSELTEKLNKQIGKVIFDTALEFAKRKTQKLSVILAKLPNDNLALTTRPIVYKLDQNKKPVECLVEIPYTPQRISRIKDEAIALLDKTINNKPTRRIPLN